MDTHENKKNMQIINKESEENTMENKKEIILFKSEDQNICLTVPVENDTVWLNRKQMSELFNRDIKTIGKHINNAFKEELDSDVVVAKFATTTKHGAIEGKTQKQMVEYYNLDVIISVGYRVKSKRGVEFRKWANKVLKQYILDGVAINEKRLDVLQKTVEIQTKMLTKRYHRCNLSKCVWKRCIS